MVRPLRIEFSGAIYHVLQRGFRRESIFADEKVKLDYLNYLHKFSIKFNVDIYAWCLMDNHVHLLICTQQPNLTKFMHSLNTSFANSRKKFRSLDGAIFAGRYKSLLVDSDNWLLQVSAYIHLNPVRARIVNEPSDYHWSSYNDYFVLPDKRRFGLLPERILGLMDTKYFNQLKEYEKYVYENIGKPLPKVHHNISYGDCSLISTMDEVYGKYGNSIDESKEKLSLIDSEEILKYILEITEKDKSLLYSNMRNNLTRQLACYALRKLTQLKLREIGKILKMKDYAVYRTTRTFEKKIKLNKFYLKAWEKLKEKLNINNKVD